MGSAQVALCNDMMKILFYSFLVLVATSPLSYVLMAGSSAPEQSTDGLELVEKTLHGQFYLNTRADWSRFTGVQLEKATVEFRKHWARDQKYRNGNRPTEENMGRIKSDLSELLDEIFRQELSKNNGFLMSDVSGENVMRITPRITNLNIYAPDRMRDHIGSSFADSKGSMTLELEIYDSVSGTPLARMTDNREDPQKGYMEWTTSGTNRRAARFMFIRWANKLNDVLMGAGIPIRD